MLELIEFEAPTNKEEAYQRWESLKKAIQIMESAGLITNKNKIMNTQVHFFCKDTHDKTRFYYYVTDRNIEDYGNDLDQLLVDDGVIDELQDLSRHGMLDNWGVIDTDDTAEEVSDDYVKAKSDENFMDDASKYKYLDEQEQELAKTKKSLKKTKTKLKRYSDFKGMSKAELVKVWTELSDKIKEIDKAYKAKETEEEEEKRAWMREELLKNKAMVSDSGWIDRTGRYWNVQAVDHDVVAVQKWGSMANAEKNNIRISTSKWGVNVMFSPQATRPPNNKQMQTLYKWGEKFKLQAFVAEFEEYLKIAFYND